jgi:ribosomal protein S18 acetylase RimI-like enzyme
MDEDPISGYGLKQVSLTDQARLTAYFQSLSHPLSDYTFSQLYTWRNSLRILWTELENHLCVFANGGGDLTLLMPPIGDTGSDRALNAAWDVMDAYNASHGVPDRSRIEYASEELLKRFDCTRVTKLPMGTDYIYDVKRMIDLAGGDLASKRQAKNRFQRNYPHRVESYSKAAHFDACRQLLNSWKDHQDAHHAFDGRANDIKRQKESLACQLALETAEDLGLRGLVVYVTPPDGPEAIRGFTFGEALNATQSSIVIEKTDLEVKGLAQFIFSEFCRSCWAGLPEVNVGDDWGLETLAWTKMSYRPVKLLQKYTLTRPASVVAGSIGLDLEPRSEIAEPAVLAEGSASAASLQPVAAAMVRLAQKQDLAAAVELEQSCFTAHCLSKRQLQYLQGRQSAVFLVAEHAGRIVGEGIALVRHHKKALSGRIYSLAVAGDCRGHKIGHKLMSRMVEELVQRGVQRIYLEVEKGNGPAIRLYESLGFRHIGKLPDYYGPGHDGIHMMHEVAAAPTLFDVQISKA